LKITGTPGANAARIVNRLVDSNSSLPESLMIAGMVARSLYLGMTRLFSGLELLTLRRGGPYRACD
jgi:hypothetical protein